MRILLSNDDGYKATGLHVLARVMAAFGDVTVVAPKSHQSAMSMAVSLGMKKLAYKELPEEGPGRWMYLDATPASCVKFGLERGYERRNPDLVVTGINHGSNASMGANYSATMGAAEEAAINGIPAIGVSVSSFRPDADFTAVEQLLPGIVRTLLAHWPKTFGTYYNVNFPSIDPSAIRGIRLARQGRGHWEREFEPWNEEKLHQLGLDHDFLWKSQVGPLEAGESACFMVGDFIDDEAVTGDADHRLNDDGWVSITPFNADLTDYRELRRLQDLLGEQLS